MKKLTLLLAVALLTSNFVGCGCCRRIRNVFNRGAYCGAPAAIAPAAIASPTYIAPAPAPVVVPQPTPVYVPQATTCAPTCIPCQPVCEPCCDPCCDPCMSPMPTSYPVEDNYYGGDCCNGSGEMNGVIGSIPSTTIDPGPVPAGP